MVISARVHYSCLALVELASRMDDPSPVAASDISQRHAIPGPFLNQILRTLRAAGWVQSIRGSHGGYRLAVDPESITVLDIADEVGCQETQDHGESQTGVAAETLQDIWAEATQSARDVLAKITLAELSRRCRQDDGVMFYI
ncbi:MULTISPECIES: RrF2 family transcriptional regulator [Crateriforma]|uniref:HTH-type transcriptional regulator CymR n=1 Tax=Crateriforma conspicua TaxID=2527996 RepID=A0A5C6FRS6_9PLAN|nr:MULTISPECIES: Rrf2 family transcriptional regulator [Crateriforma]TWU65619.1 HTH-type transcriptional regulator CymR [Crateriforma conspicua]